jgi:hypothetical protein
MERYGTWPLEETDYHGGGLQRKPKPQVRGLVPVVLQIERPTAIGE